MTDGGIYSADSLLYLHPTTVAHLLLYLQISLIIFLFAAISNTLELCTLYYVHFKWIHRLKNVQIICNIVANRSKINPSPLWKLLKVSLHGLAAVGMSITNYLLLLHRCLSQIDEIIWHYKGAINSLNLINTAQSNFCYSYLEGY